MPLQAKALLLKWEAGADFCFQLVQSTKKSPPAHFYGRTDVGKPERARESCAGFDSGRAWNEGREADKKFFQLSFTTLSYIKKSVLALSWMETAADSSIDAGHKLWPGAKRFLYFR